MKFFILFLFIFLLFPITVLSDTTVQLKNGTIVHGKTISRTNTFISLFTSDGIIYIPDEKILSVVQGKDNREFELRKTYSLRRYNLRTDDIVAIHNLAVFCLTHGLLEEAQTEIRKLDLLITQEDFESQNRLKELKRALANRFLAKAYWWWDTAKNAEETMHFIEIIHEYFPETPASNSAKKLKSQIEKAQTREKMITAFMQKYKAVTSEHFIVYTNDEELSTQVSVIAEKHLSRILTELTDASRISWGSPCSIVIFDTRESFNMACTQYEPTAGTTFQQFSRLHTGEMIVNNRFILTYRKAPELMQAVLPHEITHLVFPLLFLDKGTIPLWISEGIALYEQKAGIPDKQQLKNYLLHSQRIPLLLLMSEKEYPPYKNIFYLQSLSLVEYLISSFGIQTFLEFAYYLSSEKLIEESIQKTVFSGINSLEELEELWLKWLNQRE